MTWIFLGDTAPSKIFVWDSEVSGVFVWDTKIRPTSQEYIIYKMTSDSSGNLYVPTWWLTHSGWYDATYSWKISVDGWAETTYSWTWTQGGAITLSWYTADTSYDIKISPTSESYWWALAFWWYNNWYRDKITQVVYDGSYMWYAVSATDTGDFFRAYQYYYCYNLLNSPEENLPDTVTTVWNYFRYQQFYYCSILNEIQGWKDLSIWGSNYRYNQYGACNTLKTVRVIWDVGYSASSNTLSNNYISTVSVPSAYLSNYTDSYNYPRVWITDSKFVWY